MNDGKRIKLSRKLLIGLFVFAVILFLFTSVFVGVYYYSTRMAEYSDTAYSYARAASRFIDGDRVPGYLEPVGTDEGGEPIYEKDAYYDTVMAYLTAAQTEYPLMKYYYVFIPYEKELSYVWDADTADDPAPLGYTENYMEGGKDAVDRIFSRSPREELTVFEDETYGHIACAYYPVYDSAGDPVAVVGVDLAMEGIERELLHYILRIIAAISIVTAAAISIYYLLINRTLVRPIRQLNTAAKSLVDNLDKNGSVDLEVHTGDELEELAGSFLKMHSDLGEYIKRLSAVTAEKERISAELNVAAQIQADMLPRIFPAFPDRKEFDLYASMDPAKEVGGDFYDFFLVDADHLALVMADVSGKGVPAALFMVIAKTLIKNRVMMGDSPAEALGNVNNQLCEGNEAELFVTVWLAVIEISTGKGIAVNAGHEHPAIRRANGQYELVVYRHWPAVATMEGLRFRQHEFELYPGDSLFVYTDGVAEAKNEQGKLYGTDRMLGALNRFPAAPPQEVLAAVRSSIDIYVGEAPQFDDITMLCLRYNGTEQGERVLRVAADTGRVDEVYRFVASLLDENACSPSVKKQIKMSLEELFVNIAHYAYPEGNGWAEVRASVQDGTAVITLIDGGIPYDPLKKPDPDITLLSEERPIGGLGIYMVKKAMDEMEYEYRDGRNILTMRKNILDQHLASARQ